MRILHKKIGTIIFIATISLYILLKLAFDFSVVCANENEGFSFTYGQSFLQWKELTPGRGPLFILFYALVLKIFGFNTYSIIALHFLQDIIAILICFALYLITKKVSNNDLLGGIAALIWVLIVTTPIGSSDLTFEIRSHYALEPEYFCTLFSLYSILFLIQANFINDQSISSNKTKSNLYLFLAGILAACSFLIKANGAIILIATSLWFFLLFTILKSRFNFLTNKMLFYFSGVMTALVFTTLFIHLLNEYLIIWWRNYFLIGSYNQEYLTSSKNTARSLIQFLTRNSSSINNVIVFSASTILLIIGIVLGFIRNIGTNNLVRFNLLLSIWGFGNIFAVITPGIYQPYYYHLVYPVIALSFTIGFYVIIQIIKRVNQKVFTYIFIGLLSTLFINRLVATIPIHIEHIKYLSTLSIFKQVESFQDPVLINEPTYHIRRPGFLQLSDSINLLLPDKDKTFFIFNFNPVGHTGFTPLSYIYAKRYTPTTVDASLLRVPTLIEEKLKTLKRDLSKRPPDLLVISKNNFIEPWQKKYMTPFLNWFNNFIKENYKLETSLDYIHAFSKSKEIETFFIYKKI